MRKLFTLISAFCVAGSLFAGGLVTNINQSASWVRLPSRNASTDADAVYFNPAGLMKLENGFHVSLSNQSIWQTRDVVNFYGGPYGSYGLNNYRYEGKVSAPIFPSIYAIYKKDKFAVSFGFNPIGGGGSAEFAKGLPSFEMSPSDLVPTLASKAGVQGYRLDAYFKGNSIFMGYQVGVSYKINDLISVAVGARYVTAKNTYQGHLNDIQLDLGGGAWAPASTVLTGLATKLNDITGIPTRLSGAISGGAGGYTLAQLVGAGLMSGTDKTSIETALAAIGVPAANIPLMNVSTISATVTGATPALKDQIAVLTANASLLQNQSADVDQTGSGIAPIFSVNISPNENLNIAVKYEMKTRLELTNKTTQDFTVAYATKAGNVLSPQSYIPDMTAPITMFPNGEKTRSDMPALLTVGLDYKLSSDLKLSLGGNYYFDKSADYGHTIDNDHRSSTPSVHIDNSEIIATNGWSLQGGLEYKISDKFLVSGGYILSNKGVNDRYQSDLNYDLATHTFGIGCGYSVTDKIKINLGVSHTLYVQDQKIVDHIYSGTGAELWAPESYGQATNLVGIGVDWRF
jgi:long-chain fatty acid transport protein